MSTKFVWVLALVATCAVGLPAQARGAEAAVHAQGSGRDGQTDRAQPASAAKPGDRERWKWWLYDRAELGITDQQSTEINKLFEATIPKLRETRGELERAEDELSQAIKEHKADVATISLLVDRAESARSQYTKMRVLMLYRMHLTLSPEQRTKLEALRARRGPPRGGRDRDRDKDPPPGHRHRP